MTNTDNRCRNNMTGQKKDGVANGNTPKISVCMPMYNASAYLWDCIDSVLKQTFSDFEFLIADDGSTDASVKIVQTYTDSRIRLLLLKHDYIGTCNCLLEQARGQYIARMDADDIMPPDRLRLQLEYMESHPDVAMSGGRLKFIGDDYSSSETSGETYDVTLEMQYSANFIAHPTVMMRRDEIQKRGLRYDPLYVYAEDYCLWADALIAGLRIVNLPYTFVLYRVSDTQVTNAHRDVQNDNARKVQRKIAEAFQGTRMDYAGCTLPFARQPMLDGNRLTIIIPFLNEGDEVANTLKSIRDHVADKVEIIVINDCSDDGWDYVSKTAPYRVTYITNKQRMGVAACRDLGVSVCQTPYFLLLDAHMRFYDAKWEKRLTSLLESDDRVLLCCQSRILERNESGCVVVNKQCPPTYGALTPFKPDGLWPDIDWNYHELLPGMDIEPIANVLGAGYAASKRYWEYLHGLQGLRRYGSDEAFISFKVWREGGRCLLVKDVVIGHVYRADSPYKRYNEDDVYNKVLISNLVFSQSWCCRSMAMAYRKTPELYNQAVQNLNDNKAFVLGQQSYLSSIFNRSFEEVLQLHMSYVASLAEDEQLGCLLSEINEFIQNNPVESMGLYSGRMGQLLWFCMYGSVHPDEVCDRMVQELWDAVNEAVVSHTLSWTFSGGVSGIGWALVYLYLHGQIDAYPSEVLSRIDMQLQEVALRRLPVRCIDNGVGGILAYAIMRMKTGHPDWDGEFAENLNKAASRVLSVSSDIPSTYYAMLYLDITKYGVKAEDFKPRINEWMRSGQHLSHNRKLWKPTLVDGCIGAIISRMYAIISKKK